MGDELQVILGQVGDVVVGVRHVDIGKPSVGTHFPQFIAGERLEANETLAAEITEVFDTFIWWMADNGFVPAPKDPPVKKVDDYSGLGYTADIQRLKE